MKMTITSCKRWGGAALALALLAGCATTENALSDADRLLQEREAQKLQPVTNLSPYALALGRFGHMLDTYKDREPVLYLQARKLLGGTNLASQLGGPGRPADVTQ